ncbi:sigma-54-dependent Fis family transcriptional regulator [Aliidongia dinghuensis]|uniref:Sigma-54-dependent Fis family transcriptional regulator n=1 Tax=Aliidongia dinghuensis TaxID=1867774 RepID=A0A8J2YXH6_9PROT|nr:sigma-54 dependent transcriptional regulator [Aliidongia dinghuensis]GGF36282.1 sigma-54-dependent Fis family transcriptional regulator [Aliidongia dinghuensis]
MSSETDNRPQVLLVEDDPTLSRLYQAYLERAGVEPLHGGTIAEARAILANIRPSVVLLDLHLPDGHGFEVMEALKDANCDAPVIVVTSGGSISSAVESMRAGAYDFLVKPFSPERLQVTLTNALELRRLKRIERTLASDAAAEGFENFIGVSPAMQAVYRTLRDAAPSKAAIFVTGESGTGKELAAEAIHRLSPRSHGPFVALNCSAMPRDLVESELFGHVKGAFTGAHMAREGSAARADGGTMFLDEIGEMDQPLQAKLLRFIQTGTYQPVGSDAVRKVDVRFVCATNRDPVEEIRGGRFREDLYYRLNVVPIQMPALRERGTDIILIARYYLNQYAAEEGKSFDGFDPEAERLLMTYPWPGNVRQLANVVRNVVVLSAGGVATAAMLPPVVRDTVPPRPAVFTAAPAAPVRAIRPMAVIEREAIEAALAEAGGNVGRAAALLEIDASTIYRKKREWAKPDSLAVR